MRSTAGDLFSLLYNAHACKQINTNKQPEENTKVNVEPKPREEDGERHRSCALLKLQENVSLHKHLDPDSRRRQFQVSAEALITCNSAGSHGEFLHSDVCCNKPAVIAEPHHQHHQHQQQEDVYKEKTHRSDLLYSPSAPSEITFLQFLK